MRTRISHARHVVDGPRLQTRKRPTAGKPGVQAHQHRLAPPLEAVLDHRLDERPRRVDRRCRAEPQRAADKVAALGATGYQRVVRALPVVPVVLVTTSRRRRSSAACACGAVVYPQPPQRQSADRLAHHLVIGMSAQGVQQP